jgi:peptidoglycan/LPS O-acetylase OafA/YrhL
MSASAAQGRSGVDPGAAGASASRRPDLPALTSLRIFAATEVVLLHFFYFQSGDFLHAIASAGRQAVTFFFVLSGFILTYVYSGPQASDGMATSAGRFWFARAARILPTYWLGLVLALPFFAYSGLVSHMTPISQFVQGGLLVPLMLQAWWPPAVLAWNAPAWSLSIEAFFYAGFPLIAVAAARLPVRRHLVVSWALTWVAAVAVQWITPGPDTPAVNWSPYLFNPLLHLPQFLFGVALGRMFLFGPPVSSRWSAVLFAAGAALTALLLGARASLPWWASSNAILALVFGMVIFGATQPTGLARVLAAPVLVLAGEASYALYIVHSPLLLWWDWLQKVAGLHLPAWASFSIYFAATLGASVLIFLFVERPARAWVLRLGRTAPAWRNALAFRSGARTRQAARP